MKLFICFAGKPGYRGPKVREFYYLPEHDLFVWQKRALSVEEFNKEAQKVFEKNTDLRPFAKVISVEAVAVAAPVAPAGLEAENARLKDALAQAKGWEAEVGQLRRQVKTLLQPAGLPGKTLAA